MDSRRVLIVDDDELICASLGKGLERMGYSVITAESSNTAIGALESETFDYVVADLVMNGSDGLSVLKRSKELRPSAAVIILTAFADLTSAVDALRLGADDFLSKPCHAEELSSRMVRCADRLRSRFDLKDRPGERDRLLRETHHRVKNDFMLLSALVGLELSEVTDRGDRIRFEELRTKIQTIALIHEELFRGRSREGVGLHSYLSELCRRTVHSFNPLGSPVSVHVEAPDCTLRTETVVPLGLLTTELITNCMKHAFDPRVGGHIDIVLAVEGGIGSLVVQDDGRGLPPEFSVGESTTHGVTIVRGLASQLHGRVFFETERGTKVRVEFPAEML